MDSLEVDHERTIQQLCTHFANDNLTTQELERRVRITGSAVMGSVHVLTLLPDDASLAARKRQVGNRLRSLSRHSC